MEKMLVTPFFEAKKQYFVFDCVFLVVEIW